MLIGIGGNSGEHRKCGSSIRQDSLRSLWERRSTDRGVKLFQKDSSIHPTCNLSCPPILPGQFKGMGKGLGRRGCVCVNLPRPKAMLLLKLSGGTIVACLQAGTSWAQSPSFLRGIRLGSLQAGAELGIRLLPPPLSPQQGRSPADYEALSL